MLNYDQVNVLGFIMAITLIKEDGTGLADANCYCDLADLEAQSELLGENIASYDDEAKKAAIYVAANKYIDRLHEFKGDKVQPTQNMKLYTDLVTFADSSKDIIQANVEAAILQLKGFLFVSAESQDVNGDVIRTMDKLDVLESEIEYSEGTSVSTKFNTSTIDELLKQYLKAGSGGVPVRRV